MNSDSNDLNNHVPPVPEGDHLEKQNKPAKLFHRSFSPKRTLKEITERNDDGISPASSHSPHLKIGVGEGEGVGLDEDESPYAKSRSFLPSKRPLRESSIQSIAPSKYSTLKNDKSKLRLNSKPKTKSEVEVTLVDKADRDELEERTAVPFQGVRRFNSKETGSGELGTFARLDPNKMSPDSLKSSHLASGGRRLTRDAEIGGWGSKVSGGSVSWIVFSGLGAMAIVIALVLLSLPKHKAEERIRNQSRYSRLVVVDDKLSGEEEINNLEKLNQSRARAVEIYEAFANALRPEELDGLLHDEETILPLISKNWEPSEYSGTLKLDDTPTWTAIERDGMKLGLLEGTTSEFGRFKAVFQMVGDDLVMDWKATIGYGTSSYDDLVEGNGDGSEIRGNLSKTEFYTFSYPESEWVSYRLASPSGDRSLWIYVSRDDEIAEELATKFSASYITGEENSVIEVTLAIKPGNQDSLPNQWQLDKLLSLGWAE